MVALSRYKRTMPAGGYSNFRRAVDKEEGRSLGAGNPAEIGDDDEGNCYALEHRKNVRRSGASESGVMKRQRPGFTSEAYSL